MKRRFFAGVVMAVSVIAGIAPPVVVILQRLPLLREATDTPSLVGGTVVLIALVVAIPALRLLRRLKSPAPWMIFTVLFLALRALYPVIPILLDVFGAASVSFFGAWCLWQLARILKGGVIHAAD